MWCEFPSSHIDISLKVAVDGMGCLSREWLAKPPSTMRLRCPRKFLKFQVSHGPHCPAQWRITYRDLHLEGRTCGRIILIFSRWAVFALIIRSHCGANRHVKFSDIRSYYLHCPSIILFMSIPGILFISHRSPVLPVTPRGPVDFWYRARRRGCVVKEVEGFPQILPKYRTWSNRQLNKPQEKGMFTYIVPAKMIPIDIARFLQNLLTVRK
jgi:hypothetical protein